MTGAAVPPAETSSRVAPAARDLGLDALRGFLMLCVVIGHYPAEASSPGAVARTLRALDEAIYLFHIPAFFVVSAVLLRPTTGPRKVLRRSLRILTAFLAWGALYGVKTMLAGGLPAVARFLLLANWNGVRSIMWFLPALVSTRLGLALFQVGGWPVKTLLLAGSAVLIVAPDLGARWHPYVPWGVDIAVYLLPALLTAQAAYRWRDRIAAPAWSLALGFAGIVALLYRLEPVRDIGGFAHKADLAQFSVMDDPLDYALLALALCLLLLAFAKGVRSRALAVVGVFSLPILVLHPKLVTLVPGVLSPRLHGAAADVGVFAATLGVCVGAPILLAVVATRLAPTIAGYLGLTASGGAAARLPPAPAADLAAR